MGSSNTKHSDFRREQWEKLFSDNAINVLANKSNHNIKIAEHNFKANSDKEYKKATKLYNLRKGSKSIVETMYQDLENDSGCTKTYSGHVYTEWIPITLENVAHVPFPDVLHLYRQTLDGVDTLSAAKGCFKVNEGCIGVNTRDVVKVYHSADFSQTRPDTRLKTEEEMVHSILNTIEQNTDLGTMPPQEPSLKRFILNHNESITLDHAKARLQEYARIFNGGHIPDHLDCVRRAGGAENIRNKWINHPASQLPHH